VYSLLLFCPNYLFTSFPVFHSNRVAWSSFYTYQESPDYVRELIRKTRALTDKPFGVGVILAFPHEQNLKAILDEKVAVLQVYWGECSKDLVDQAHSAGVKIIPQVSVFLQITLTMGGHTTQFK